MQGRSRIIFDTSGLNALADDPDSALIVRSLGAGFRVLISETSICEVVGTSKPERRVLLLDLCTHLVHAGDRELPRWYWDELARFLAITLKVTMTCSKWQNYSPLKLPCSQLPRGLNSFETEW
jgi:hypothetical protein